MKYIHKKLIISICGLLLCGAILFANGKKETGFIPEEGTEITNLYSWAQAAAEDENRSVPPEGFDGMNPPDLPEGFDGTNPPEPPEGFNGQMPPEPPEGFTPGGMNQKMQNVSGSNLSITNNKSSRNIETSTFDLVENKDFGVTVQVNLTTQSLSFAENKSNVGKDSITLTQSDNGIVLSSTAETPVKFILTGEIAGTVTVSETVKEYAVVLENATITGTDGPSLQLSSKETAFLVIASNSTNVLTDSTQRSKANNKKGAVYAKAALVISAEEGDILANKNSGTLEINGSYKNGIYSDDYIRFRSGVVAVNISARDGIRCISGFIMDGGDLTINGTGSAIDEESKGIKVDGEESTTYMGEGNIIINNGYLTITTVGKAITAGWEAEEDGETESTSDDPNANVIINGGVIDIVTSAVPYETEQEDGTVVSCSPEGIEAKNQLIINGGNIRIRVGDDGLNAGKAIGINGGNLYIESTMNDGIDSNGSLSITGGSITCIGSNGVECAFDCDNNAFEVSNCTLLGLGGSNITQPASNSLQPVLVIYETVNKGSVLRITDKKGNEILSFTIPKEYETMIISSPLLQSETEYILYADKEKLGTFTTGKAGVKAVTSIGSVSNRFGGRGMGGPGQMGNLNQKGTPGFRGGQAPRELNQSQKTK
jgi:hypothetical protein